MRAQINCKIDPYMISGSVLCTHLSPESRAATSRVSGGQGAQIVKLNRSIKFDCVRLPNVRLGPLARDSLIIARTGSLYRSSCCTNLDIACIVQ